MNLCMDAGPWRLWETLEWHRTAVAWRTSTEFMVNMLFDPSQILPNLSSPTIIMCSHNRHGWVRCMHYNGCQPPFQGIPGFRRFLHVLLQVIPSSRWPRPSFFGRETQAREVNTSQVDTIVLRQWVDDEQIGEHLVQEGWGPKREISDDQWILYHAFLPNMSEGSGAYLGLLVSFLVKPNGWDWTSLYRSME